MGLSSDSSSSEEDEKDNIFKAICDPTVSANYGSGSYVARKGSGMTTNSSYSRINVETVTGDEFIDSTLHSLKENLSNFDSQRFCIASDWPERTPMTTGTGNLVSQRITSDSSKRGGAVAPNLYAVKQMTKILDSQITIRSHNKKSKYRQRAAQNGSAGNTISNGNTANNSDDEDNSERLKLLEGVTYDPNLPEQVQSQTSNEWLRNMKKRYRPCYYSSEEEEAVEERCRALAIPAAFIASGGLKSIYAEYKNTNPQKVQRVRLCKGSRDGLLVIAPLTAGARNRTATANGSVVEKKPKITAVPASNEQDLSSKEASKAAVTANGSVVEKKPKVTAVPTTKEQDLSRKEASKTAASNNGTESANPCVKKVKKKSRKRGPKKKKKKGDNVDDNN